jgi:1,4-dihydroxy-2-naphthoate polyprenyltransferase
VNYANDYFDGVRGVDTPQRVGPRRAVAAGLVAPARMKAAIGVALAVAGVAGLALAAVVSWWLLLVGLVAFAATLGYSGGPRPYASAGLGEVFVFVFFGLVATIGSQYVHDERVRTVAVLAALPIGFLATAILVVNNLRDVRTDRGAGKVTLAVRLGEPRTRALFMVLVALAYAALVPLVGYLGVFVALPVLSAALTPALAPVRTAVGPALIPALVTTARLELVFGALLAVALVATA